MKKQTKVQYVRYLNEKLKNPKLEDVDPQLLKSYYDAKIKELRTNPFVDQKQLLKAREILYVQDTDLLARKFEEMKKNAKAKQGDEIQSLLEGVLEQPSTGPVIQDLMSQVYGVKSTIGHDYLRKMKKEQKKEKAMEQEKAMMKKMAKTMAKTEGVKKGNKKVSRKTAVRKKSGYVNIQPTDSNTRSIVKTPNGIVVTKHDGSRVLLKKIDGKVVARVISNAKNSPPKKTNVVDRRRIPKKKLEPKEKKTSNRINAVHPMIDILKKEIVDKDTKKKKEKEPEEKAQPTNMPKLDLSNIGAKKKDNFQDPRGAAEELDFMTERQKEIERLSEQIVVYPAVFSNMYKEREPIKLMVRGDTIRFEVSSFEFNGSGFNSLHLEGLANTVAHKMNIFDIREETDTLDNFSIISDMPTLFTITDEKGKKKDIVLVIRFAVEVSGGRTEIAMSLEFEKKKYVTRPKDSAARCIKTLEKMMPDNLSLKSCWNCAFAVYSPIIPSGFGHLGCFVDKGIKNVRKGNTVHQMWGSKTSEVSEVYTCKRFEKREIPQTTWNEISLSELEQKLSKNFTEIKN